MNSGTANFQDKLVSALGADYSEGFDFAIVEDGDQTIASLTNPLAREFIALDKRSQVLTIKYSLVEDKKTGAQNIYKSEVARRGDDLAILTTAVASEKPVHEIALPQAQHHDGHDDHTFDSLNECIAAFDGSDYQTGVLTEANRTCETQYPHLECCLSDGTCWSVVLVVRPTSWKCLTSVAITPSEVFAPINS